MKSIGDVVSSSVPTTAQVERMASESSTFIDKIFKSLKMANPAWRNGFKSNQEVLDTKAFWLQVLVTEGVTKEEDINRAIMNCVKDKGAFFPSIGQFIEWAKKPVTHAAHMIIEQRNIERKSMPMPDGVKEAALTDVPDSPQLREQKAQMIIDRFGTDRDEANKLFGIEG